MQRRIMLKKQMILFVLIIVTQLAVFSRAEWVQDGASLNDNIGGDASEASITMNGDVPYVTWADSESNTTCIYLKYLNGSNWESIGNNLNVDPKRNARTPGITIKNNVVYLAWYEENSTYTVRNIFSKKYQAGVWEQLGDSLSANKTGMSPKIVVTNAGIQYVVFAEYIGGDPAKIIVKSYNAGSWVQIGGSLNIDENNYAIGGDIALFNDLPYVIWREYNFNFNNHVYVKHLNNTDWIQDGGDLDTENVMDAMYPPAIVVSNTLPYVSLYICDGIENNLCVKRLTGNAWTQEGSYLNANKRQIAGGLSLAVYNNTPYVAHTETINSVDRIFVKYFDGNSWVQMGGSLNVDPAKKGEDPNIAISSQGVPYVAWVEGGNSNANRIYVKHWVSPATPTSTVTTVPEIDFKNKKLIIYPNPARDIVHFAWEASHAEKAQIDIYNTAGERIVSLNIATPGQKVDWNTQNIAPGIYFCRVALTVDGTEKVLPIQKIAIMR